jgi:uncharacterized protein
MSTAEASTETIPAVIDGQILPPVNPARRTEVEFASDGLTLAGHLYRPPSVPADQPIPALAMAGPMTSVKEETLPHYAVELAKAGFAVLTFDNRNFGASQGSRPQHLSTSEQVEDLKSAISYLASRPDVDAERIGLACVCLGAGYGLEVAAMDRRVKAVALVGGGYNITDTYCGFLGADGFAGYMDMLNASRQLVFESGEEQFMSAVAGPPDYAPSAMPVREAFEYYRRAHDTEAPAWQDRLTVASMEHIIGWNVMGHAHLLTQPLIVVHGTTDALLPPVYAQQVHDEASSSTKELVWITTHNHVELYDQAPYVPQALAAVVPFPTEHLIGA